MWERPLSNMHRARPLNARKETGRVQTCRSISATFGNQTCRSGPLRHLTYLRYSLLRHAVPRSAVLARKVVAIGPGRQLSPGYASPA